MLCSVNVLQPQSCLTPPQGHAERFHFIQCVELSILLIAARTPRRLDELEPRLHDPRPSDV